MKTVIIATIVAAPLLFPFLEAWKDIWMWREFSGTAKNNAHPNANKMWHINDAMRQALFFVMLWALHYCVYGSIVIAVVYTVAMMFWFWLVNDALINVFGLGKPADYIGNTALTDRMLRKLFGEGAGLALVVIKAGAFLLLFVYSAVQMF